MRHPRHFPFRQDGFALVVTLSLMVLLALLAVGLLGLSAVSLRSARLGADEMTARTNARLALLLAVGELQRLTGPDQRVTADAGILAKDDATPPANHRWVGVWRTDGFKGEPPGTPVIEPETRRGQGYRDRRSAGRARNPATECLGWLVSGPEPEPTAALPEAESVIARGGPQPVRVAKVLVEGHNRGALAWFVADESTKVKLSLADPYAPGQPDAGAPEGPAMNRWLAPQTHDASAFFNDETPAPDDAGAAKLVSRQQLELSPLMASLPQGQRRALLRQYADDFTAHGKSVLADPLHGGLKCDLTAYLEDGPADALGPRRGIADRDPVNPAPGASRLRSGPRFGMLRNWYALRQAVEGRGKDATITARLPHTTPAGRLAIVDPGEQFLKPVVQPVLTEAVYYINHVLDTSGGNTRVVETVYPRVVLWNPFSTRLATEGYVVFFDFSLRLTIRCEYLNRTGAQETSIIMDSISQPRKMLGFFIPPTVFEPGEALTFCAPSRDREFNEANFLANP
ncbi:MAG: hypothetical protein MUF04_09700, partial [Akkermansiaceae bacterium]|nr:hypothetical protein [Akkermansiaceae bacterium]